MAQPICQFKDYIFFPAWKLTFDLWGKLCSVPGLKQLQLPVQVLFSQIDVPGSQSCRKQSSCVRSESSLHCWYLRRGCRSQEIDTSNIYFFLVVSWKLSVFLCQQFGDFLTEGEDKEIFILRFVHVYLYFSIILICISNPILIFSKILQFHSICKTFCSCYLSLIQHFIGHNREPNELLLY